MWMLIRPGAGAQALELAVSGGPVPDGEAAVLAGIVAQLRAAAEITPPAHRKEEARSRMLSAVRLAAIEQSRAAAGPGRIRTAAISAAAVAGAGFVVAGATDTNPLSTVGSGVARITGIGESPATSAVEFTLEGIVTAIHRLPHGSALEVRTPGGTVLVDVSGMALARPAFEGESLAEMYPEGASVRVRAERANEGELPRALAIEVRPSPGTSDSGNAAEPSGLRPDPASLPPANNGDSAPPNIDTRPTEVPERTPVTRPTPAPEPTPAVRPANVNPTPTPTNVRPEPTRPPVTATEAPTRPTTAPERTATPQSPAPTPTAVPTRTPTQTATDPELTTSSDENLRPAEEQPPEPEESPSTKPQSGNSTISDANMR